MHSFNETIKWVQAIILQGERVLSAHSRSKKGTITSKNRIEEQFFLNACEKAVRWTKALSSEGKDPTIRGILPVEELREFRKSLESTDARNNREHEEEYLRTGGKSIEDKMVDASSPNSNLKIIVEPGITMIRNGDIIIGGSVSVKEAMQAAEKLNGPLVQSQHTFAKFKHPQLKDKNPDDYPHIFAGSKLE